MNEVRRKRIEYGDFQTPEALAKRVCQRLKHLGLRPNVVIEPTCGVGAFVLAAIDAFPDANAVCAYEINPLYLGVLREQLRSRNVSQRAQLVEADFFHTEWKELISRTPGSVLVLGNFPWVTSSVQGAIGGTNLPKKSNFQGRKGFDAISGAANFDISEWMLLEVLSWFVRRSADIAMLVKTAVARKVLAQSEKMGVPVSDAMIFGIDAKKEFNANVEACLLVIRIGSAPHQAEYDYTVFDSLEAKQGRRVGHRGGMTIADLDLFHKWQHLIGESPQKWRSGVKHDASAVMEFSRLADGRYQNGLGEISDLESTFMYPLLKGSDIGSAKDWRGKFVLVTQQCVGEDTAPIEHLAPKTWAYLLAHAEQLDSRGSTIYARNPRYSIFGVGEYAFRPWRIAICGLYKRLRFRLVSPIEGKPVMFDDTIYYVSFNSEREAEDVLRRLESAGGTGMLSSLVFWDEKRPIKTSILNILDWTKLDASPHATQDMRSVSMQA